MLELTYELFEIQYEMTGPIHRIRDLKIAGGGNGEGGMG